MKSFAALMRLQLLSRYADFKPQHIKEQLKEKQSKMLWRAIGVVILIVYLLGFLITIENTIINSLTQMGVADLMISLAVSLGGDSDTLACITGGIAEAFYKAIPQPIVEQIWQRLPDDFKVVLRELEQQSEYQLPKYL